MKNIKEETRYLASLAVFRELYNSQKDVYGVICEFINGLIVKNRKYNFDITEITNLLNSAYEIEIPEAVVRTCLGRLDYLTRENRRYNVDANKMPSEYKLHDIDIEIFKNNDEVISRLFDFIHKKTNKKLSELVKEKITHCLCAFLLDEQNGDEYYGYISAFFIENKSDAGFRKQVDRIREGVILYSGLRYNDLNDSTTWDTPLTIYLDTEILFYLAGYDGELYRSLFSDFYKYVDEINSKARKKLIKLKYFPDVKKEIEGFFTKARYIVEGKSVLSFRGAAMPSIVDGCKDASDILAKKTDFYILLNSHGITEDTEINYLNEENHQYNIVDSATIESLSEKYSFDVTQTIGFLNFISINRKGSFNNNFKNIKCILLTNKSNTTKIAWDSLVKPGGSVPLATTLHWLTNKFWFILSKSFGEGKFPKSFDVVTKAQILLSKDLNNSLSEKFEELQSEYGKGKLTDEQVKARIVDLRAQARKPEDIEKDDVSEILDVISEESLAKYINDQEHYKKQVKEQADENVNLKLELEQIKEERISSIEDNISTKNSLIVEKEKSLNGIREFEKVIERAVGRRHLALKLKLILPTVIYYIALNCLIYIYDWNEIERWVWALELLPPISAFTYLIIKESNFNFYAYIQKHKRLARDKVYEKYGFDKQSIINLESDIKKLEDEIKELRLKLIE